ncbi:MAG: hypothetical protein DHS20C01_10920 [marine bacterium B5-7]|nr:MAG: hypothetical protein DHS20C01_10920 [marine bacterium B5-7]
MNILIEAHHPAHIHFFKHVIRILIDRGDEVLVLGRDRDVMRSLLDSYSYIPNILISATGTGNRFPLAEFLHRQRQVASSIRTRKPDIVMSLMGTYTQSAKLFGVPNLIFTDSEFQRTAHAIAHPFATRIHTPECFGKSLGRKHIRYRGYHELAFLHPDRFTPDPCVLNELGGIAEGDYMVLRVSAWDTLHDIGEQGLANQLTDTVRSLSRYLKVFIVPERGVDLGELESHRLALSPHRLHDVLAFARLVVSEGASTASEAACLGVPAVYINSTSRSYLDDQENRYGLVHNFRSASTAIARAMQLAEDPPSKAWRQQRRQALIDDHIDVTAYVIDQIDRYRSSAS